MQQSDQSTAGALPDRFRLGVVALALGIVCILSLAYTPGRAGPAAGVAALLGIALLVVGTLTIGSSAPTEG